MDTDTTPSYNLKTISQLPLLDKGDEFSEFDNIFYAKRDGDTLSNEVYIEISVNNASYKVKLTDLMEYIAKKVVLRAKLYVTLHTEQEISALKTFTDGVNISASGEFNVSADTTFANCNVNITNNDSNSIKNLNVDSNVILSVAEYMDGIALSANWA